MASTTRRFKKFRNDLILCSLGLLLGVSGWGSSLLAATYYVATNGSDSSAGTITQPWRTIQKAANMAAAGDTVLIRGGTYNEQVRFTRDGTSSQRITFQNYDGETVVIDGAGLSTSQYEGLLLVNGADYTTIQGLEVRNSRGSGIEVTGNARRVIVASNIIHNNGGEAGIFIAYNTVPTYTTVQGNNVYGNTNGGIVCYSNAGGYVLIESNTIYGNTFGGNNWDAIGLVDCPYTVVRNNTSYNNGQDHLDNGGNDAPQGVNSHHYLIEGNLVYMTPGATGAGTGIKVNNGAQDVIVRRNRVSGTSNSFQMYEHPFSRVAIYHNTFYSPTGNNLMLWNDNPAASWGQTHFKNNVFAFAGNWLIGFWPITIDGRGILMDGNLYHFNTSSYEWNSQSKSTYGTSLTEFNRWRTEKAQEPSGGVYSSQTAGQIFKDAANRDFTLVAGSGAIDRGVALTTTTAAGSGTQIPVANAWYFFDGYGWLTPDTIQVGANAPVQIVAINKTTNTLTADRSISWSAGDRVSLPYNGGAPDIGAFEFGESNPPPSPPANLRVRQ